MLEELPAVAVAAEVVLREGGGGAAQMMHNPQAQGSEGERENLLGSYQLGQKQWHVIFHVCEKSELEPALGVAMTVGEAGSSDSRELC